MLFWRWLLTFIKSSKYVEIGVFVGGPEIMISDFAADRHTSLTLYQSSTVTPTPVTAYVVTLKGCLMDGAHLARAWRQPCEFEVNAHVRFYVASPEITRNLPLL